jgi:hypothetical protein
MITGKGLGDIISTPQPSSVISATGFIQALPVWVWGIAGFAIYKMWR